mmetsp:Transcript_41996/g.103573  ORF Transcript_41996/g.103573 Transcript_41996/m.103573 type:complete len:82 (-) Transcript_41996:89-334(-)
MKLFRQAAEQGYVHAQLSLGNRYLSGIGVAHDVADAARYLCLAADQGDVDAQCWLGFLCEHGHGTKSDLGIHTPLYPTIQF